MSESISLVIKWSGKEFHLEGVALQSTVSELKDKIYEQTQVKQERQKLLGLKYKGKLPGDDVKLCMLSLKNGQKIMMMGTREESLAEVIAPPKEVTDNNVVDDFDVQEDEIAVQHREEFLAKIEKRINNYKVEELNPPRADKKLLVLDIDYTIFDHRSSGESGYELMRPYLHEFLTSVYPYYDIGIWSATGMKWIKAKLEELNVTSNANYKIFFLLDSGAMITVETEHYGVFETKPLGVIWGKYEQFSEKNTIMFDDLRRNFVMNPSCGLKIRPFKNAHQNRDKDRELLKLSEYLLAIKDLDDFTALKHSKWERFLK